MSKIENPMFPMKFNGDAHYIDESGIEERFAKLTSGTIDECAAKKIIGLFLDMTVEDTLRNLNLVTNSDELSFDAAELENAAMVAQGIYHFEMDRPTGSLLIGQIDDNFAAMIRYIAFKELC